MENSIFSIFFFFFFFFIFFFWSSLAQQPYLNNLQLNCYGTNGSSTLGYTCNGPKSCSTYLTFRSTSTYQSPVLISYLLNTNTSAISELNALKDVSHIPIDDLILIPATCHCDGDGDYYQHNATYKLQSADQTYQIIANDTYQGLSTCQALIAQNPYNSRNLTVGSDILVPLRCACPDKNQTADGVKYLLNYLITWGDDVPTISQRFGVDYHSVLQANSLTSDSVIFPFTTLLLPIKNEPTLIAVSAPPSPSPVPPSDTTGGSGSSNTKWVLVGVGIGILILVFSCLVVAGYFYRRRRTRQELLPSVPPAEPSSEYSLLSGKNSLPPAPAPFGTSGVRGFLDSLMVYKFGDLEKSTGHFDEQHRIQGSVYRAVINGDDAAVKRMKGDVSKEINILKQINHSNIVRLSGFCVHQGNTYLVYEFVEKGSVSDWLHRHGRKDTDTDTVVLSWKNRVRIANDVADALNYLHNYTNPPYVHKDIKSSNILLDAELRAKLANFGLARAVEEKEAPPQLTRHVVGTQGYMAPEYLEHGLVTTKLDVYAFGVVILELLSGKEASYANGEEEEEKGELFLSNSIGKVLSGEDVRTKLKDFIDPSLGNEYPFDLAYSMAELAMHCVKREAGSRPATSEVLMALTAIYNSTLDWDPSDVVNPGSMIHGR